MIKSLPVLSLLLGLILLFEPMQAQNKRNGKTRSVSDAPSIDEVVPVMIPPQTINLDEVKHMIGYPKKAQELGIAGIVHVRILVDKEGDYVRHKIVTTPHRILSESVNKNIHKIVFTPAIDNNRKPTMYWVNLPVNFQLPVKSKGKSRRN